MTYAFTHMGDFILLLPLGLSLLAGVLTSRLTFGPQGWDLGLKARILASRLGFGPGDWDLRGGDGEGEEGGEGEGENSPYV